MKYLKMLGLAAIAAMALMAFLGASSASADVLCTENNTPGPCLKRVTSLKFTLSSGTSALLTTTAGETLVTCTESTVEGNDELGSETSEPGGKITSLTWGGCSSTVDNVEVGKLDVKTVQLNPGEFVHIIYGTKTQVTVSIFGVSCTYGTGESTELGKLLVGSPATAELHAAVNKTAGGFLCPSSADWKATYTLTNHTGLWVSKK